MKIFGSFGVGVDKAEANLNTAVDTDGLVGVGVLDKAMANGVRVDAGLQAHETMLSSKSVINAHFIVRSMPISRLLVGW